MSKGNQHRLISANEILLPLPVLIRRGLGMTEDCSVPIPANDPLTSSRYRGSYEDDRDSVESVTPVARLDSLEIDRWLRSVRGRTEIAENLAPDLQEVEALRTRTLPLF
jgi:hypothetical protein